MDCLKICVYGETLCIKHLKPPENPVQLVKDAILKNVKLGSLEDFTSRHLKKLICNINASNKVQIWVPKTDVYLSTGKGETEDYLRVMQPSLSTSILRYTLCENYLCKFFHQNKFEIGY